MDKLELSRMVDAGLGIREISEATGKSQTTVWNWLNRHGLKTKHRSCEVPDKQVCPGCMVEKSRTEFYQRRGGRNNSSYCKKCTSAKKTAALRAFKALCVAYKGGECQRCGYDKCQAAFDFHHIDPSKKDFLLSKVQCVTMSQKIKEELDKCELVCSNCHREIHSQEECE